MAIGEPGLLGEPVPSLVQVELSPEPANATIRHRPMEESPVRVPPPSHKHATLKSALVHQVHVFLSNEFVSFSNNSHYKYYSVMKISSMHL
jgi:hypothetical protein